MPADALCSPWPESETVALRRLPFVFHGDFFPAAGRDEEEGTEGGDAVA